MILTFLEIPPSATICSDKSGTFQTVVVLFMRIFHLQIQEQVYYT